MRITILIVLVSFFQTTIQGQKIAYNIPEGYENKISNDDYKKIVDMAIPIIAKRYLIDNVKGGTIYLKKGEEMQALNLHNIIGKCLAVKDRSQWDKVVQGH